MTRYVLVILLAVATSGCTAAQLERFREGVRNYRSPYTTVCRSQQHGREVRTYCR